MENVRSMQLSIGWTVLILLSFAVTSHSHDAKLASDGCHNQKDNLLPHCHAADETIGFDSNESGYYVVSKVIDGDTMDLVYEGDGIALGVMRIRLFGVDAPETKENTQLTADAQMILERQGLSKNDDNYDDALATEKSNQLALGQASKSYVKNALEGKRVYVMFDNTDEFPFIMQGTYGRYLAYVFYCADDEVRFLNLELIAAGHADIGYVESPFRYRWAFVSDLKVAFKKFREAVLPHFLSCPMDAAPDTSSMQRTLTTNWALLKNK